MVITPSLVEHCPHLLVNTHSTFEEVANFREFLEKTQYLMNILYLLASLNLCVLGDLQYFLFPYLLSFLCVSCVQGFLYLLVFMLCTVFPVVCTLIQPWKNQSTAQKFLVHWIKVVFKFLHLAYL